MSVFFFGLGSGHLPDKADKIAAEFGASLTNFTDPGCSCGHGCSWRESCPSNRRHWFETRSYGFPFDNQTSNRVMTALANAGINLETT